MRQRVSRFGAYWACTDPTCDGKIGAHQSDGRPLGEPADEATREARIRAHKAFDRLWLGAANPRARTEAYRWLAREMGLTAGQAHIGKMTLDQCEEVVDLCHEHGKRMPRGNSRTRRR